MPELLPVICIVSHVKTNIVRLFPFIFQAWQFCSSLSTLPPIPEGKSPDNRPPCHANDVLPKAYHPPNGDQILNSFAVDGTDSHPKKGEIGVSRDTVRTLAPYGHQMHYLPLFHYIYRDHCLYLLRRTESQRLLNPWSSPTPSIKTFSQLAADF